MIELVGLPDDPLRFGLIAVLIGFGVVAMVKVYGLFFMRWKTPFRVGEAMNVNHADVVEWEGQQGYVSAGGELWRATSKDVLVPGDVVSIDSVSGLSLTVKKKSV